jgi:hypothetical protein
LYAAAVAFLGLEPGGIQQVVREHTLHNVRH